MVRRFVVFSIFVILSLPSFAQKEDYVWQLGNVCLNFNNTPATVEPGISIQPQYNLSCIADKDGNFLFCFSVNKLYDHTGNAVNENIGSLRMSQALVPYPGHPDKTLFFYDAKDTGVVCFALDNMTSKKELVKIFGVDFSYSYAFVQQGYSDNIWMIEYDNGKFESTLITKHGFQNTKTWSINSPLSLYRLAVNHSNDIIVSSNGIACAFDNIRGEFGEELCRLSSTYMGAFSMNDRYYYYISTFEDNYAIFRVEISNREWGKPEPLFPLRTVAVPDLQCGADGNIYVCHEPVTSFHSRALYVITDAESDAPRLETVVSDGVIYLPYTFHYRRGFTADVACDAVNFDCNDQSAVGWSWDLGDGTKSDLPSFTYVYDTPGTYAVELTVTTDAGEERVFRQDVTVAAPPQTPVIKED